MNTSRSGLITIIVVVLTVVFSPAILAGRGFRGPASQVPPTGRTPNLCFGQGDAELVIEPEIATIGEPLELVVMGEPLAPLTLLVDVGAGPVFVPNVGTFCLDLGPDMRVVVDGISDGTPRIDENGVFALSANVPNSPRLRGQTFFVQALFETDNAPDGIAITNMVELMIDS